MVGGARGSTMDRFSSQELFNPVSSLERREYRRPRSRFGGGVGETQATTPESDPVHGSNSLVERQAATVSARTSIPAAISSEPTCVDGHAYHDPAVTPAASAKMSLVQSAIWHSSSMASSRSRARRRPHGRPLAAQARSRRVAPDIPLVRRLAGICGSVAHRSSTCG